MQADLAHVPAFARWLARPGAHRVLAVAAALLLLPSLGAGLCLDDYVLQLKAGRGDRVPGLPPDPFFLFTFTTGEPAANQALIDEGALLPWWTEPRHKNAFFRPLSSLTHLLDFALWPGSPALMHAQSVLWYVALVLGLAHVYRALASGSAWLCGLALFVFALDDAHGSTVAWLANRNALVSATLALPALSAYHRHRTQGFARGAWLAPACFALGLCAGETALSLFGYLLAYAVYMDDSDAAARPAAALLRRVGRLWPFVLVIGVHRALYHALGLGSFGSSAYHDPLGEPLGFLLAAGYHLPVLLSAQLGGPGADAAFWGDPSVRTPLLVAACVTLLLVARLARPVLAQDREARFWTLGMLLAAIPVSASVPGERLLLVLGVGAAPLLARIFDHALRARVQSWPLRLLLLWLAAVHLVLGPLFLPVRAFALHTLGAAIERVERSVPEGAEIAGKTVIVVNAPLDVWVSYLQPMRAARGKPRPAHLYWLASASSEITLTRVADRRLRVALERGFLRRPEETHYRGDVAGLPVGAVVTVPGVTFRVAESMPDGRPRSVDATLARPPGEYLFLRYAGGALRPLALPPLGQAEVFPAEDFFRVLASELRR